MAMSGLPMRSWKSWERLPGSPEKLKRNPEDSQAQWEKMNIERFFRRDAGAYMDVDGDYIIDRIQREVDKNERLTKAIQKAKERAADS